MADEHAPVMEQEENYGGGGVGRTMKTVSVLAPARVRVRCGAAVVLVSQPFDDVLALGVVAALGDE